MNILQISPQIPYPLFDGGKVGIFNLTKYLALRGHKITLLAFDRDKKVDTSELEKYCKLITLKHSTKNSVIGAIKNICSNIPYNISKYYSMEFEKLLNKVLDENNFDIVHVDHLHMSHYGVICKKKKDLPILLREHNIESTIMERFIDSHKIFPLNLYFKSQLKRIKKYESKFASQFDVCATITNEDESRLKILSPNVKIKVVTAGVEEKYFEKVNIENRIPNTISFFGALDWIPNQNGVEWFLEKIFPLVLEKKTNAKVFIIGKSPTKKLLSFQRENIVFKGFVSDLKSELQKYDVTIVPLKIGGGMRIKIIESFAMQIPIVSTSVGAEGIKCKNGKDILIANSENDFANAILKLFDDTNLKKKLIENAYNLCVEKYQWTKIIETLESAYKYAMELNS